jgi:hypothetical protein
MPQLNVPGFVELHNLTIERSVQSSSRDRMSTTYGYAFSLVTDLLVPKALCCASVFMLGVPSEFGADYVSKTWRARSSQQGGGKEPPLLAALPQKKNH